MLELEFRDERNFCFYFFICWFNCEAHRAAPKGLQFVFYFFLFSDGQYSNSFAHFHLSTGSNRMRLHKHILEFDMYFLMVLILVLPFEIGFVFFYRINQGHIDFEFGSKYLNLVYLIQCLFWLSLEYWFYFSWIFQLRHRFS